MCLGFALPENFRCPYGSLGFTDFWRRWHVSLSTWLRDYVYISLGGNRIRASRTAINLMLTMLLGGLWHGASWHFVVWGALHGAYLVVERWLRPLTGDMAKLSSPTGRIAVALFTFAVVTLTWAFFRAQSFGDALQLVAAMFGAANGSVLGGFEVAQVASLMAVTFAVQWRLRDVDLERAFSALPVGLRAAGLAVLIVSISLVPGDDRAFLYFQF
jgi:D-alanyl-lipoteichoic acid acyltransferase DltB (MBOAT superfamily)